MSRQATIKRKTKESNINISINLDGVGNSQINSGVGFFDHMLEQISKHGAVDITLTCQGDNHIDDHHSVEDVGICLGQAIKDALDDKKGINRYASCYAPLDEALTRCVIDLSGRSHLSFKADFPTTTIGEFDSQLVQEFFTALAHNAHMTLHIDNLQGINSHHIAESIFKSFALAFRQAIKIDSSRADSIPSSKGTL